MKRFLLISLMAVMMAANANAQAGKSDWTLNTNAWSTNYWTTLLYAAASTVATDVAFDDSKDSLMIKRILPSTGLVFPVGIEKEGFDYPMDIYHPYHRAFSNPFKHIGDYAIGLDAAWTPSFFGLYAGAYFKSQEITFANEPLGIANDNLRGFYFQPRAGISFNFGKNRKKGIEAGVFYDMVTGCGGSMKDAEKDMLKSGFGLDFAFTTRDKDYSKFIFQFSLPLHNFLNEDYTKDGITPLKGMKRRVGYFMLTRRIML